MAKHQKVWLRENTKHLARFSDWLEQSGQHVKMMLSCDLCKLSGLPNIIEQIDDGYEIVLSCSCTERSIRR